MVEMDTGVLCCRDRLAQRVAARLGPDGLIAAPCESRVLESALALRLFTVEQAEPAAAERLTRYLRATLAQSPPDPLQDAIGRAALGASVTRQALDALAAAAPLSSERELLLLRTVAAEVGCADFPRISPAWTDVEMTAARVLAAPADDSPHAVSGHDWATLAPACRPGPAPEGAQSARLLGLLALRRNPAYRPAVRRALTELATALRPDGGLPYVLGMDVRATALAGLALVRSGYPGPHPGVLADALAAQQNPDGGFAAGEADDTARCLEFLRTVAPGRHHATIAAAKEHLLARRQADGGYGDVATTAAVATALEAPERARRFVLAQQRPDGGFDRGGARTAAAVAFHAVQVLDGAPRQAALGHLGEAQNPDGGWGHRPGDPSDPISTAYAAAALSRSPGDGAALRRALGHLVRCRQPDGGYRSRPDRAAPGPLLYDVPVLAESCVLLGLTHATTPGPASDRTLPA